MRYADVAATLALVLAMGGTAMAAHHYLIHSIKQVSPHVRTQLRGRRGPAGPPGPSGGGSSGGGALHSYEGVKDAPVTITSTNSTAATGVGSLHLPAGNYQLIATVHLYSVGGVVNYTPTNCLLSGGGELDTARTTLNFNDLGGLDMMLTMVATAHVTVSSGRDVFVACWRDNTNNTVNASELRIAAIQADSVSSVPSG
jgi:hypothetical protein